jgi:hypothetical protein
MPFSMNTVLKQKKEVGMKKLVIVAIAVLLAMPVLSHAGSATSKWDLTIGGYVMTQFGWADQETGSVLKNAQRRSGKFENERDEFGNLFAHVEGRLNFVAKGPDAWGAKTASRLEFDFLGAAPGQVQGEGYLRHAYLTFDWANTQLLIGNTWYGMYDPASGMGGPAGTTLASSPNPSIPSRAPQIRLTQRFGKNMTMTFGFEYPALSSWMAAGNDFYNDYTRSEYPNVYSTFVFASDACGKIGPNMLKFGIGGTYGRKAIMRNDTVGTGHLLRTSNSEKQEDGWLATAFTYVPIIPERNMNKAGALAWYGGVFAGQGLAYNAQMNPASYIRNPALNAPGNDFRYGREYSTPRGYALYTGMMVYLHDQLYLSGLYDDTKTQVSNLWRRFYATQTSITRTQFFNLALVYTPNPAIVLGVEYSRVISTYAQYGGYTYQAPNDTANPQSQRNLGNNGRKGTMNEIRFSAQYLF